MSRPRACAYDAVIVGGGHNGLAAAARMRYNGEQRVGRHDASVVAVENEG
jgi:flavin-dependent dehydrogenase